jgi:uracil-DNA glycosylase
MTTLPQLLTQVRACTLCAPHLPLGPRPILQLRGSARVLVAGQAPGQKTHEAGRPFSDLSGDRLREWMGIDAQTFYDAKRIAIVPMGFCYPGRGRSGDLPPRPECSATWHAPLLARLPRLELSLLIGQYALAYHLPDAKGSLTDIVRGWRERGASVVALPHPSPRNNLWLKRNPWFERDLLPMLRERVAQVLAGADRAASGQPV